MSFNYFVAYDLHYPGQNYSLVIERIQSLGQYAHMQLSMFYLKSDLTMVEIHNRVREVMDPNDKLAVVWAQDAVISNYNPADLNTLQHAFNSVT
jgi:hypothetical protein